MAETRTFVGVDPSGERTSDEVPEDFIKTAVKDFGGDTAGHVEEWKKLADLDSFGGSASPLEFAVPFASMVLPYLTTQYAESLSDTKNYAALVQASDARELQKRLTRLAEEVTISSLLGGGEEYEVKYKEEKAKYDNLVNAYQTLAYRIPRVMDTLDEDGQKKLWKLLPDEVKALYVHGRLNNT